MPEKNRELINLKNGLEQLKFKCKYDIDTINMARKELFEKSGFMYISIIKKLITKKYLILKIFLVKIIIC
jgi:hypothetical protein